MWLEPECELFAVGDVTPAQSSSLIESTLFPPKSSDVTTVPHTVVVDWRTVSVRRCCACVCEGPRTRLRTASLYLADIRL